VVPAPRRMMQRTLSSALSSRKVSPSRRHPSIVNALSFSGRLSTTVTTSPSRCTSTSDSPAALWVESVFMDVFLHGGGEEPRTTGAVGSWLAQAQALSDSGVFVPFSLQVAGEGGGRVGAVTDIHALVRQLAGDLGVAQRSGQGLIELVQDRRGQFGGRQHGIPLQDVHAPNAGLFQCGYIGQAFAALGAGHGKRTQLFRLNLPDGSGQCVEIHIDHAAQ